MPIHQYTAGYDALASLADRGNEALFAVHGKYYEAGCIPCVLYVASGTSLDWALGVAGIPYVYRCQDTSIIYNIVMKRMQYNSTDVKIDARSIELRDTGSYGFLLPPSEIIPNAEEAWAFHVVAAQQVIQEFSP